MTPSQNTATVMLLVYIRLPLSSGRLVTGGVVVAFIGEVLTLKRERGNWHDGIVAVVVQIQHHFASIDVALHPYKPMSPPVPTGTPEAA